MTESATLKAIGKAVDITLAIIWLLAFAACVASIFVDIPIEQRSMKVLVFGAIGLALAPYARQVFRGGNRDD